MTRLLVFGLGAALMAQDPMATKQAELQVLQQEMLEARARTQRLVDLRVRHDLGLPTAYEVYVALTEADRAALAEPGASLDKEQHEIERLSSQHELLEHKVSIRRRENIEQALAIARPLPAPIAHEPEPAAPAGPEPAPGGEPAGEAPRQRATPAAAPGSVHLIRGSTDHRAVGRALFAAGRYADALAELQLAAQQAQPEFGDLFQLARCFERLGKAEDARRWYLEIEARDTRPGAKGPEPGNWARSARAARQIMEWLQDRGSWQPAIPIESIGAGGKND